MREPKSSQNHDWTYLAFVPLNTRRIIVIYIYIVGEKRSRIRPRLFRQNLRRLIARHEEVPPPIRRDGATPRFTVTAVQGSTGPARNAAGTVSCPVRHRG